MTTRQLVTTLALCVMGVLNADATMADDCSTTLNFLRPHIGHDPSWYRWQSGSQISIGCSNCTSTEDDLC